uniref:Protein Abitram n=1 Tax=Eutreptiella gymnastica TaxID=73025 RepID=A0A7S1IBE4_9EUGL|mmetsp:Transcript_143209/g.249916  ORF Transcript_143209/g.249916 Transcript_143209/m.249916 type:complete len:264 (+) Transcript_143209:3-794(+)
MGGDKRKRDGSPEGVSVPWLTKLGIPEVGDERDPVLWREPPCITISECHYTRHFRLDCKHPFADQYILRHHNDVCIIGLAESHYLLRPDASPIKQASFSFGKCNRMNDVHFSGKRKKGCFIAMPDTLLCELTTEDGEVYRVQSGVAGWLYELNENLLANPDLIRRSPYGSGYIAILNPKDPKALQMIDESTSDKAYTELLRAGRALAPVPPRPAPKPRRGAQGVAAIGTSVASCTPQDPTPPPAAPDTAPTAPDHSSPPVPNP